MYKTIRHGENSLQYTILPQNDDFRIEGKLSSAGSSCSNSDTSRKPKVKRPRRRSFFAYLGLIFVCTVIVGAILIPFLVSAECLPNPTAWFLKTKAALTRRGNSEGTPTAARAVTVNNHRADKGKPEGGGGTAVDGNGNAINVGGIIKSINYEGGTKLAPPLMGNQSNGTSIYNDKQNSQTYQQMANITNITISLAIETATEAEILTAQQAGRGEELTLNSVQREEGRVVKEESPSHAANLATEQRSNSSQNNMETVSASDTASLSQLNPIPDTSMSTVQQQQQQQHTNQTAFAALLRPTSFSLPNRPNINSPRLLASNNIGSPAVATNKSVPTIMTRIMQVPLLKSAAKKPIIPPVLAKTNSPLPSVDDHRTDVNVSVSAIVTAAGSPAISSSLASSSSSASSPPSPPSPVAIVSSASGSPPASEFAITKPGTSTKSDWIQAHWPYIDPSTYFQWTGYKAEDSVLLPALLGFALIGVILIVTICLVARNKRTIVSSVRKRNRNDIEETGAEDNATLLTTTNLSDED